MAANKRRQTHFTVIFYQITTSEVIKGNWTNKRWIAFPEINNFNNKKDNVISSRKYYGWAEKSILD